MEIFAAEWANLLFRWFHLIVGIGWIGTSFYFMALDYSLTKRGQNSDGILGTAWQVHGGGFYHVDKYVVAPPSLPDHLHWFKWDAYLTWVSGFGLLTTQYYINARAFLIDPAVMPLEPWQAVALSLGGIVAGWAIYEGICRSPIGNNAPVLALAVFALMVLSSVYFSHVFSSRGAFLHVGALTGSIMATNVFAIIIPNQKKMVAQLLRGETPDPRYGRIGKQRSTHNNYLTLPVLLMMVSPHYGFLSSHPQPWLIVALIFVAGGLTRHYLNCVEARADWSTFGWTAPVALCAIVATIYLTAPKHSAGGQAVSDQAALALAQKHCVMCHAVRPTHEAFSEPPKNVVLETAADMRKFAAQIFIQVVQNKAMPLGNQTNMTDDERATLGRWTQSQK